MTLNILSDIINLYHIRRALILENNQEITVSVKYSNDGNMGSNQNNNPKPQKPPKVKKQKQIGGICPYCKTHLQTNKGEDKKCPQCGVTVAYAEFKNQHAVLQTTEAGKKKFNFINLLKKWWFWVAIILTIGLIVGLATPSSPKNETIFEKNQTISVDDYAVSVIDVSETNTINGIATSSMTTTNNYLIVLVKLTNNNKYSHSFKSDDFKVYYNTHVYEQKPTESYWYGYHDKNYKGYSYGPIIESGLSDTVYLVFEVPQKLNQAQYILSFEPKLTEVKIKLY